MIKEIRKSLARLLYPSKNSMSLPAQFLKFGSKMMTPDWSDVNMSDHDLYTGYGYAAIRNRANNVARIALEHVRTKSKDDKFVHPYLEVMKKSNFPERKFWNNTSTYIDLEGVYYLMAVRNYDNEKYGAVQQFKLLSPYNIKRILDKKTLEVKGYVESRNGMVREIPKEIIIEMRELNPFSEEIPFAMTDAAKESQFTLKTAGDFTRKSLKHNINAPGSISTDVILDDKEFEQFVARIKSHTKGEPLFGNGTGAITYTNMQNDLSKSALKDINEINRDLLFAVSGVSKTLMGIEQSGTTRDTSKVQKELSIENHILPQIQLIVDALNLDYKTRYPKEFEKNEAELVVDNPLGADHEAELSETNVFEKRYDLFEKLINKGVDKEIAASYVMGNVEIDAIDIKPSVVETEPQEDDEDENSDDNNNLVTENKLVSKGLVQQQEGALKNAIQRTEAQLLAYAISRLNKKTSNDISIELEKSIVTMTEKNEMVKELALVLGVFYGLIVNLKGRETIRDRMGQFVLPGNFNLNDDVKRNIKRLSNKVSESHIDTVANDIYETARDSARAGKSLIQIQTDLKNKFIDTISDTRAKTIARTETNRAFTLGQYEADKQFVKQNKLEGRVYKQWVTRSDHPCEFCLELEAEGKVPFDVNFRDLGDDVSVGDSKLAVNFEPLEAGNAHPNAVFASSTFAPYNGLKQLISADYDGPAIQLKAGKYETTIGPNHPIMTTRGLVKAAEITEQDQILYDLRNDSSFVVEGTSESDFVQVPTIEDAAKTLISIGSDVTISSARHDFHGDVVYCKGEVEVINPTGELTFVRNSGGIEKLRELNFMLSDTKTKIIASDGSSSFGGNGVLLPSTGGVGGSDVFVLADSHYVWIKVNKVTHTTYKGRAYDCTTDASLYCSDGFVVSNCSCTYELIIEEAKNSLFIEELEKKYNELDKRTADAKEMLEKINVERKKLEKEKDELKKEKVDIDKMTADLEHLV